MTIRTRTSFKNEPNFLRGACWDFSKEPKKVQSGVGGSDHDHRGSRLAYKQAKQANQLLVQGVDLGPLHGIPYGLKDIIAVPEYKTTWGSTTFKDQVLDIEAW